MREAGYGERSRFSYLHISPKFTLNMCIMTFHLPHMADQVLGSSATSTPSRSALSMLYPAVPLLQLLPQLLGRPRRNSKTQPATR